MNTPAEDTSEPFNSHETRPAALSPTRPMYWSVRREFWENRSIYIGPLVAAGVYLVGFLISLHSLPRSTRALATMDPAHRAIMIAMPYSHAAFLLMLTAFVIGIFYSLDALHGERSDRSMLFWKSLPVSDLTTVLSKAIVPLAALPLLAFVITVALQLIMLLFSSAVFSLTGVGAAAIWAQLPLFQMEWVLLYGLAVLTLWYAPIYGWLLLISGWARRAPFLWFVLPPIVISVVEKLAFHTSYFGSFVKDRLVGFAADAFAFRLPDSTLMDPHLIPLSQLTPGRFLSSPGLWIGLLAAVGFLAAAVRLRRYREPI